MPRSNQSEAERSRERRLAERTIEIPPCADRDLRDALEAGPPVEWLLHIFGPGSGCNLLAVEFAPVHTAILSAIDEAIRDGTDAAVAAPRSIGKSTLTELSIVRALLTGEVDFAVLLQAAGRLAENSLASIRAILEGNIASRLASLYPEVCVPAGFIASSPQRSRMVAATGQQHDNGHDYYQAEIGFRWRGDELTLPAVPGSPSAGAILLGKGLDASVRGTKKAGGRRPQLVVIDDPEPSIADAKSPAAIAKLESKIESDIAGLGTGDRPCGRVFLSTIQAAGSCSDRFTDPKQKPAWRGQRHKLVETFPARLDLWQEYVERRQRDYADDGHRADDLLDEHFDEMHQDSAVTCPHRFNPATQRTALQAFYDFTARNGEAAAASELQNEPLEEEKPVESELTAHAIQRRINGFERGIVPPGASLLVSGVDVGKRGCHSPVAAFRTGSVESFVVGYAYHETKIVDAAATTAAIETAIRRTLWQIAEERPLYKYADAIGPNGDTVQGEPVPVQVTLVDARYGTDAVVAACAEITAAGYGLWIPCMGHGQSYGNVSAAYRPMTFSSDSVQPGSHYYLKRGERGAVIAHHDADFWKLRVFSSWLADPGQPGAATLFGVMTPEEQAKLHLQLAAAMKAHISFCKHQTAERYGETVKNGAIVDAWSKAPGRVANHFLDAFALCHLGAGMKGVNLLKQRPQPAVPNNSPKPSKPSKPSKPATTTPTGPSQPPAHAPTPPPPQPRKRRGNVINPGRPRRSYW